MSSLGFTFYPKDWWTSDTFYDLSPIERYFYLECIFMMYVNGGSVANNKVLVERRLGTTISDNVWSKIVDKMIETEDGQITHVSVNSRLKKAHAARENGKSGGRPKGSKSEVKNPENPEKKPNGNPPLESKSKIESKSETENKRGDWELDAGSNSKGKAPNGDIPDTGQSGINPADDHPLKDIWNQIGMIYPKAENVGALPDHFAESLIRQVRVMKKVDLSMNEVRDLWEAWKLQKLDGKAEYRDMNGVYQNFVNTYRDKNIRSSNTQTHQQHDAEQAQLKRTKELLEKRNAGG